MFQTCSNSLLCTDSQYSSQQLTIGASLKHKNTQPLYIFNRENPQNSEPQNGPRSGLDYIALIQTKLGVAFFLLFSSQNTVLQRCSKNDGAPPCFKYTVFHNFSYSSINDLTKHGLLQGRKEGGMPIQPTFQPLIFGNYILTSFRVAGLDHVNFFI